MSVHSKLKLDCIENSSAEELTLQSNYFHTVLAVLSEISSGSPPVFHECTSMYCDTCDEYVCLKCSLKSHHRHQCDRAEFLFTQHKQQIEASLEPMKKKIDELEETLTRFDTREKELNAQEKTVQEEISKAYQELMNQLQESQRKLSQELSTAMQAKLQRHSTERAKAETALEQMKSCRDFVSKELKTRTDYQIQAAKVELIKRIDGTHSVVRVTRLQPTQPDTVFTADRNVMSACGHIGRISDKAKPVANNYFTQTTANKTTGIAQSIEKKAFSSQQPVASSSHFLSRRALVEQRRQQFFGHS